MHLPINLSSRKAALDSARTLSREAKEELQLFESRLKEASEYHVDPSVPKNLTIFPTKVSPLGIVAQEGKLLEWICLHCKGH